MKKEIQQGEMIPKGYGFAYLKYEQLMYVCYPFPLNHIVRIYRNIWHKVRHAQIMEWEISLERKKRIDIKKAKNEVRVEFFDALENGFKGLENLIDKWKKEGFRLEDFRTPNSRIKEIEIK